jgi:hypothetical protein
MLHIDNNYQFLFVHVPKCAGTSIEKFFGYNYDGNKYFEHKFEKIAHPKHFSLDSYSKIIPKHIMDNLYKFAFIRNPFELMVSLYNYALHSDRVAWNGRYDYEYKRGVSFDHYVRYVQKISQETQRNVYDTNAVSLKEWVESDNIELDFIGRFENLEHDFQIVMDELGIKDRKIPFENKSKVKNVNYREYYTNTTKDIIYNIFERDLKKYNYDF